MRVGIIVLKHESNTFLPGRTTLADFQRELLALGEAVRDHYRNAHHEAAGFFDGLRQRNIDAVPLFAASATPGSTIEQSAYESLHRMLLNELSHAGPIDGLLISAHGAAVAEQQPDMDGHWLTAVRTAVGPYLPIICTIDPHANLSLAMVRATDALLPYRTNPHIDQKDRGLEAATLIARTLRGEIHPTQAAAFPPVAINIACQHTESPPASNLASLAADQRSRKGVLTSGVVLGFPYADVVDMGSSFIVVTDNDPPLAQQLADEMANYLLKHRHDFVPQLPDIDAAISLAEQSTPPVCLLDLGDNVGGGAPGDGTLITHALLERNVQDALVCLCDPEAAQRATNAGVGATINLQVGGISPSPDSPAFGSEAQARRGDGCGGGYSPEPPDHKRDGNSEDPHPNPPPEYREREQDRSGSNAISHGPPLHLQAKVLSLHGGKFTETAVRHGGKRDYDMGPTAIITAGGLTVLIHSLRTPPFSLNQILSCDIDPTKLKIIVAKGVNAPIAAYAPVCKTFIQVDTPGVTTAAMTRLPFHHRRRPLFPFEQIAT